MNLLAFLSKSSLSRPRREKMCPGESGTWRKHLLLLLGFTRCDFGMAQRRSTSWQLPTATAGVLVQARRQDQKLSGLDIGEVGIRLALPSCSALPSDTRARPVSYDMSFGQRLI